MDEFGNINQNNKADNRIVNLREVGHICNMQNRVVSENNISGVSGVYWADDRKKWRAEITIHKKTKNLGSFANKDDAVIARFKEERGNPKWTCQINSSAYKYLKENNLLEEEDKNDTSS